MADAEKGFCDVKNFQNAAKCEELRCIRLGASVFPFADGLIGDGHARCGQQLRQFLLRQALLLSCVCKDLSDFHRGTYSL